MDSSAAALLDRVFDMLETHSARRAVRLLVEEAPLPSAAKIWKTLWDGNGVILKTPHTVVRLLLLRRKLDPNAADPETGNQALHWIAAAAHMAGTACHSIKLLLDYGANVHARNKDGKTPLSVALIRANVIGFEYLLKHGGVDANETDLHGTPVLVLAAAIGHPPFVRLLLRHGADVGKTCSNDGRTALSYAFDATRDNKHKAGAVQCVALLAKPLIAELAGTYDEVLTRLLPVDQVDLRHLMVSVFVDTITSEVHTNQAVAYTGVRNVEGKKM